jgi:hypothetical protein
MSARRSPLNVVSDAAVARLLLLCELLVSTASARPVTSAAMARVPSGGVGHRAVDLLRGHRLLLHGRGDRRLVLVDLPDHVRDLRDRGDRLAGVVLDRLDPARDPLGGARGLLGQILDLAGDHREALAASRRREPPRSSR